MQEEPYGQQATPYAPPPRENAFLGFVQRPRILLTILAGWALLGFLTELALNSPLFVETHNRGDIALDGILGGLALNWEGIPLAVLYFYCARNPERFHGVFWLALVAQGASVAANMYHWLVTDTYSFESVVIPLGVAAGLGTLVFIHLFAPREQQPATQATSS
jgi:hypothetical protein